MKGIEDIIKSTEWMQNLPKSFGVSSQISEILKTQGKISSDLAGFTTISQLAKTFQQIDKPFSNLTGINMLNALGINASLQQTSLNSSLAAIKGLNGLTQFAIPQATITAIASISKQHDILFGNLRSISEVFNRNDYLFSQIGNIQFAVSGLSGQLSSVATAHKKWNLIKDFEEITQEVVLLNERIFDENGITKDGYNELNDFLQRIENKVDNIDSDGQTLFWKILTLLGFIITLTSEARNWIPKPEYSTRQEVETLISKQFGIYQNKLKEDKEFRIVDRVCKVLSKPGSKAVLIISLPVDFEVTILQFNSKWAYVSYFSPIDNLPQTGWIMKKYLKKMKKQ
ncbi:hypothetical protein [Kaistella polysaccharea]|uniref:hypothetical protein n=1 Tax=Kaistella polysaccharea TaxID=2878534 RepID=UPI001CF0FF52|nr:hypothetical protein [Kaistella polysaccharea]